MKYFNESLHAVQYNVGLDYGAHYGFYIVYGNG